MIRKLINFIMIGFSFSFPISIAAANGLLGLMLLLWIIEGDYKNKLNRLSQEKMIWFLFSIPIFLMVSAFFSESKVNGFLAEPDENIYRVIINHYMWIPMFIVIYITSIDKKYLQHILSAFLMSIFFSETISYLIYFELIDTQYFQKLHLMYHLASTLNPTPFMHHIWYSFFLSVSIFFILHKLSTSLNIYLRSFLTFFLLSATINLFINGGRTGQIAFVLALFVYILFKYRMNIKSLLYTVIALGIIISTAYTFSPNFHTRANLAVDNIQSILQNDFNSSWGQRIASNINTVTYLSTSSKHFILGAGAGDSKNEYLTFAQTHMSEKIYMAIKDLPHLHNQYLQFWLDGGIFTLFSFLLFLYYLSRLPLSSSEKALLYASITIIMFVQLSSNLMFRTKTYLLILFITSYFIILSKKEDDVKAL